jgi:hypothetical protein
LAVPVKPRFGRFAAIADADAAAARAAMTELVRLAPEDTAMLLG